MSNLMIALASAILVEQLDHQKELCFLTITIAHFWEPATIIKMLSLIKMM